MQRRAVLLAMLLLGLVTPVTAQVPPNVRWQTLEGPNVRVTFGPDLELLARRTLEAGERAHAVLRESLTRPPSGRIDIILTDNVDFSNGSATP
jgi:hypothetical protein